MIGVAWVTEAEQTERVITALIVLLVVVAALLTLLTIWYWRHTSPKRRGAERQPASDLNVAYHDLTGEPTAIQPVMPDDAHIETGPRHLT